MKIRLNSLVTAGGRQWKVKERHLVGQRITYLLSRRYQVSGPQINYSQSFPASQIRPTK
jgi:hypothetical protein